MPKKKLEKSKKTRRTKHILPVATATFNTNPSITPCRGNKPAEIVAICSLRLRAICNTLALNQKGNRKIKKVLSSRFQQLALIAVR